MLNQKAKPTKICPLALAAICVLAQGMSNVGGAGNVKNTETCHVTVPGCRQGSQTSELNTAAGVIHSAGRAPRVARHVGHGTKIFQSLNQMYDDSCEMK